MLAEWEAVEKRISCRSYQNKLLPADLLQKLEAKIHELNAESGLNFQFYHSEELTKPVIQMTAAMFSGNIYAVAALVGGNDPISSEKVGYYGQELVLYATALGLGTCWVAGTYNPKSIHVEIGAEEKLWDVIPIGFATEKVPKKQSMIRLMLRKKDRKIEQFVESEIAYHNLPKWIQKGAEAVRMGPSAVNQQPIRFQYHDGRIFAKIWKEGHGLQYNDMGIAKKQFEIGAAQHMVFGTWQWGDGGEFQYNSHPSTFNPAAEPVSE